MARQYRIAPILTLGILGSLCTAPAWSGDWPAWRGADRTAVSPETGLLKQWPTGGPPLAWKVAGVGVGYAAPAIVGDRIYVVGAKPMDDEFVQALSAKDGSSIWKTRIGKVGPNSRGQNYPGARCTPTVEGESLYALGSDGDLACLETATGKVRWQKNLRSDFGGRTGNWAYAESPLIDGDVLVCCPGGSQASVVALKKSSGEPVWQTPLPRGGEAAYASVLPVDVGGVRHYVLWHRNGVAGLGAKDGKILWRYEKFATGTNCSTPIFHDGCVFVTASGPGGGGCALLRLAPENGGVSATEVFHSGTTLSNHHGGVVRVGGQLYGTNNSVLICMDFKTGKVLWQERSVGKGSVAAAEGHVYLRAERGGQVALVEATPDGYKEKGRFTQPENSDRNIWAHPVIANAKLYLRDHDKLFCYDIKAK